MRWRRSYRIIAAAAALAVGTAACNHPTATAFTRLFLPTGSPPRAGWPVLLLLHGFNSKMEHVFGQAQTAADMGMAAIAVSGPIALDDGMHAWPVENMAWTYGYIERAVEPYHRRRDLDFARVYVGGFSQGAHAAIELAIRHPSHYRGVFAMSPVIGRGAQLGERAPAGVPLWVLAGRADPAAQAAAAYYTAMWRQAAGQVRVVTHDEGHVMPPGWPQIVTAGVEWLLQHSAR